MMLHSSVGLKFSPLFFQTSFCHCSQTARSLSHWTINLFFRRCSARPCGQLQISVESEGVDSEAVSNLSVHGDVRPTSLWMMVFYQFPVHRLGGSWLFLNILTPSLYSEGDSWGLLPDLSTIV